MAEPLRRCPVCRARWTPDKPLTCRRCAADLSGIRAVEQAARQLQTQARRALRAGHWQAGLTAARQARRLVDDASTQRTVAVAWALCAKASEPTAG